MWQPNEILRQHAYSWFERELECSKRKMKIPKQGGGIVSIVDFVGGEIDP
jgi:hypothetical protein